MHSVRGRDPIFRVSSGFVRHSIGIAIGSKNLFGHAKNLMFIRFQSTLLLGSLQKRKNETVAINMTEITA